MRASITSLCQGTAWDKWIPLENSWRSKVIPTCPGLYRILLVDKERHMPAYIGQSANLKERLGALKHVYGDSPPLHTPHFAGPALWEWRRLTPGAHFLVSVAPFPTVPKPLRLGLECLALTLCQQEHYAPPLANFGRTHDEWCALWRSPPEHRAAEVEPTGPLDGNPHGRLWCGMSWAPWISHHKADPGSGGLGLYRLRIAGCDPLLYVGQGEIVTRLKAYRSKMPLECSWTIGNWTYHRRLELVSTTVGAHLLSLLAIPLWQFEKDAPPGGPTNISYAA